MDKYVRDNGDEPLPLLPLCIPIVPEMHKGVANQQL